MGARLFSKFLLILVPVFLVISILGLNWVAEYELRGMRDDVTARIGNKAARISGALERNLETVNTGVGRDLLSTLLSDRAILCAELRQKNAEKVFAAAPPRIGCKPFQKEKKLELSVGLSGTATLRMHLTLDEVAQAKKSRREYSLIVIMLSLLAAVGASWIGFRLAVGKPLKHLLTAIRHTSETGARQEVEYESRDELGIVIASYNQMQLSLSEEENRVRRTLKDLDHVYHNTPALLYSTGIGGDITIVSDHWLDSTGYRRDEVVGRMITEFMSESSVNRYQATAQNQLLKSGHIAEVPVQILCKNGQKLDVLVAAVANSSDKASTDGYLCIMSDISRLKSAEQKLRKLANTDHLSGLPNRFNLMDYLSRLIDEHPAEREHSAVLFIDFDNFKWINDTYGHQAGDKLLVEAADRLRHCVSKDDFVARLGGDEFAIICSQVRNEADVVGIANKILERLSDPFDLGAVRGFVSGSIGIALLSRPLSEPEEALRLADLAMYKAKKKGRNTYSIYSDELSEESIARSRYEHSMREGLANGWFSLRYQPIIRLSDMRAVGVEALLRLSAPDVGPISPADFIPIAEQNGQIEEIGRWVIGEGIRQLAVMDANHHRKNLNLSMNLSPKQLNESFVDEIRALMCEHAHLAGRIVLEITETAIANNIDMAVRLLNDIRKTGIRIALDDFGTGYSSLNHLNRFPVDVIKLDRSLIQGIGTSSGNDKEARRCSALIRATVALARDLDLKVVAEGIETVAAAQQLQAMNVDFGQGYLFSPPIPVKEFIDWRSALDRPNQDPKIFALREFENLSAGAGI